MPVSLTANGITYADGTIESTPFFDVKAIFGYGDTNSSNASSLTNLVNIFGVVATDTTGVGSIKYGLAAAGYGGNRAIFGYGYSTQAGIYFSPTSNLVSNLGVVSTDTTGVGTGRTGLAAAGYGGDKAIFGYGTTSFGDPVVSMTNLVSNVGAIAADVTGVGTARFILAAAGYGGDKAIFGFGGSQVGGSTTYSLTNLVSNVGVVSTDTIGVGSAKQSLAAAGYGGDKAIFANGAFGTGYQTSNLVSNIGVVSTDTSIVGSGRMYLAAAGYGGDKAIFGYGLDMFTPSSVTNLLSNVGVIAADVTGVGTARSKLAAASYSL